MIVNDDELYFAKTRENAIIPSKKEEDAGYDLYACFDEEFFVIEPNATRPITTGIATAYSKKYYTQLEERSSTGKIGLKISGGVFDSGYRGEYMVLVYNANTKPIVITKTPAENLPETFEVDGKTYSKNGVIFYPYTKAICEIIVHFVPGLKAKEISYEDLKNIASERGVGNFGSSGK